MEATRDNQPRRPVWALALVGLIVPVSIANGQPTLFERLHSQAPTLDGRVLGMALNADRCGRARGQARRNILTVIDYSLPSTERRLWVFDLDRQELTFHELVAHGVNTGADMATEFSNRHGSRQSSLGLFSTGKTYTGRNGYSLKLHGLERGINHEALARTIVIHGAWYVSEAHARSYGRLGRSWGCPALERKVARPLIDSIKGGSLLFVYFPNQDWLDSSSYLEPCAWNRISTLRTAD